MGTKTEKDIIGEMAKEVGAIAEFSYLGAIDAVHEKGSFESPIERVMVAALMARPLENCDVLIGKPWEPHNLLHLWNGCTDWVGSIHSQVPLGPYRVDFYLQAFVVNNWEPPAKITDRWLQLVIECDGHDYHERTKEQARHDKRRDRWFQTHGLSVLRFTGSEIWADPFGCVDQIHDAFLAAWDRRKWS